MGIAENIKHLRQLHDLSQKDFGLIAGVSDKAVSAWENGLKEPRMGAIQKIADHFGLQKSNIIENNGLDLNAIAPIAEPSLSAPSEPEYTDEEKGIIRGYRKAPDPLKEIVRFTLKDYMKDDAPAASPKEQPKEAPKEEAPKIGKWGQLLLDHDMLIYSESNIAAKDEVESLAYNPQFEKIVDDTYKELEERDIEYEFFVDGLIKMVKNNRDDLFKILDKPHHVAVRFLETRIMSKMR